MTELLRIAVSLLPVFIFLMALIFFDSYKLVKLPSVLRTIVIGFLVALACYFTNNWLVDGLGVPFPVLTRYIAPVTEELLKAAYIFYLIKAKKVGFMVDAAIYGFAVGAGFAFVENIFYLKSLQSSSILVWLIRGFGTAVMHSTATALYGIITRNLLDRHDRDKLAFFVPGLAAAILVHSFYNHFLLPPVLITVSFLVALPLLIVLIFEQSEKATRKWLGIGFDTDVELLMDLIVGPILCRFLCTGAPVDRQLLDGVVESALGAQ